VFEEEHRLRRVHSHDQSHGEETADYSQHLNRAIVGGTEDAGIDRQHEERHSFGKHAAHTVNEGILTELFKAAHIKSTGRLISNFLIKKFRPAQ